MARARFFAPVDWTEANQKRLEPPFAPPLEPFLAADASGDLRFVEPAKRESRRPRRLATPRRVTFDEENDSPKAKHRSLRESHARERDHRRSFRAGAAR